jgi:hypothetical protein
VPSRFVSERRHRKRHPQIIINALWNQRDLYRPARFPIYRGGASHKVISADGHQRLYSEFIESGDGVFNAFPVARYVCARSAQHNSAVKVYARNFVDRQFALFVRVALGEPFKPVVKSDSRAADFNRFDSDSGDHSIRSRRRAASDQNAYFLYRHNSTQSQVIGYQLPVISCQPFQIALAVVA